MNTFKVGDVVRDPHCHIIYEVLSTYVDDMGEDWYSVNIIDVGDSANYHLGRENFPFDACTDDELASGYLARERFDKEMEELLNE